MKALVLGTMLSCALLLTAQQQPQERPPYAPPPYETPAPGSSQDQVPPPLPPDMHAPAPQAMTNADIQSQIQEKLATEPVLANTVVKARVDDSSVVLSGTVASEQEHDMALRIARSYSGSREVVDKIQIQPQT